jgi:hypothetical protein
MRANPERLAFLIGREADFIECSEETRKVGGAAAPLRCRPPIQLVACDRLASIFRVRDLLA